MTLSGLRSLDKSAIVCFLFVVSGKREPQCRKLLVSFEPAKAFLGFVHGRGGPAQSKCSDMAVGSAYTSSFSRLAQRSLALRPAHSRCHQSCDTMIEGFSHF